MTNKGYLKNKGCHVKHGEKYDQSQICYKFLFILISKYILFIFQSLYLRKKGET